MGDVPLHDSQQVVVAPAFIDVGLGQREPDDLRPAGTYEFDVDGRYWSDSTVSTRSRVRRASRPWGGAHGILASISSGLAADYQAGFAHFAAWRTMLIGLAIGLGGVGLFTASARQNEVVRAQARERDLSLTA